jgi:hypothetical protein
MTKETAIEMLDYSKPPPGYEVAEDLSVPRVTWGWCRLEQNGRWEADGGFSSRAEAVAAAWAHCKVKHDPPGCSIGLVMSGQGATTRGDFVIDWGDRQGSSVPAYKGKSQRAGAYQEARAAAWAWHDRRHALARDIADQIGKSDGAAELLAAFLRWTDDECAEVEAYAALPFPRSVDMPAALRRVLLPEPAR